MKGLLVFFLGAPVLLTLFFLLVLAGAKRTRADEEAWRDAHLANVTSPEDYPNHGAE